MKDSLVENLIDNLPWIIIILDMIVLFVPSPISTTWKVIILMGSVAVGVTLIALQPVIFEYLKNKPKNLTSAQKSYNELMLKEEKEHV